MIEDLADTEVDALLYAVTVLEFGRGESNPSLRRAALPVRVLVDCSHAQTRKDYTRQPEVLADLVEQIRAGNRTIMGVMLESNLEAGNQKFEGGRTGLAYGVSITDPCIDRATTERCLCTAADFSAGRAARRAPRPG